MSESCCSCSEFTCWLLGLMVWPYFHGRELGVLMKKEPWFPSMIHIPIVDTNRKNNSYWLGQDIRIYSNRLVGSKVAIPFFPRYEANCIFSPQNADACSLTFPKPGILSQSPDSSGHLLHSIAHGQFNDTPCYSMLFQDYHFPPSWCFPKHP